MRRQLTERRKGRGFTLIELLIVMAIISILLGLVGTATSHSMRSTQISTSLADFGNQMASAVLMASRDNKPVAVRIYRYEDEFGDDQFRSFQLLRREFDGTLEALDSPHTLGNGLIYHPDPTYSTLLGLPVVTAAPPTTGVGTAVEGYDFVEFDIQPDGSTNLPVGEPWCLTVVYGVPVPPLSGATLPADYRTATINPATCAVREY